MRNSGFLFVRVTLQRFNNGLVMVNFYPNFITCSDFATITDVAGITNVFMCKLCRCLLEMLSAGLSSFNVEWMSYSCSTLSGHDLTTILKYCSLRFTVILWTQSRPMTINRRNNLNIPRISVQYSAVYRCVSSAFVHTAWQVQRGGRCLQMRPVIRL
jgi:hypothetical protein